MPAIRAYSAARYVIGAHYESTARKLFQIAFGSDSSVYVSFPYFRPGAGTFGEVHLGSGTGHGESIRVGRSFLGSTHQIKYSHHPSGQAHFSLSGKVRADVKKSSVPLADVDGHLFTFMVQGIPHFDAVAEKDKGTKKRGVVLFGSQSLRPKALKFLGLLYPKSALAGMVHQPDPGVWMNVVAPDGSSRLGLLLQTPISSPGGPQFLMITSESIPLINAQQEVFYSLLGGFDPPNTALERSSATSFLMFIYPSPKSGIEIENAIAQGF